MGTPSTPPPAAAPPVVPAETPPASTERRVRPLSSIASEGVPYAALVISLGITIGGLVGAGLFLHADVRDRIVELKADTGARLDRVEARFGALEARMTALEIAQAKLTATIEVRFAEQSRQLAELIKAVQALAPAPRGAR